MKENHSSCWFVCCTAVGDRFDPDVLQRDWRHEARLYVSHRNHQVTSPWLPAPRIKMDLFWSSELIPLKPNAAMEHKLCHFLKEINIAVSAVIIHTSYRPVRVFILYIIWAALDPFRMSINIILSPRSKQQYPGFIACGALTWIHGYDPTDYRRFNKLFTLSIIQTK